MAPPVKHTEEIVFISTSKNGSSSCWGGRNASSPPCLSKNAIFVIATVIGVAILILGLLALAGCFAPQTGAGMGQMLQQIRDATEFLAVQLGTKPYVIAIVGTAVGVAFTFTGIVGSAEEKCRQTIQTSAKSQQ